MSGTASVSLEQALAEGAPVAVVLDLADEAIERAVAAGDAEALEDLARRLGGVATSRGGEWRSLAIAGDRAAVLAALVSRDRPVAREPSTAIPAPPVAPNLGTSVEPTRSLQVEPIVARPVEPITAPPADSVAAEGAPATTSMPFAGWWIRAAAYVIDLFLLGVAYAVLAQMPGGESLVAGFVYIVLPLAYFSGMHAVADGATLGKRTVGVAVRTVDGGRVGLARAVGRALVTLGLWITWFGGLIDIAVLAGDGRKQSVHDKAAGTVVVHVPRRLPAA